MICKKLSKGKAVKVIADELEEESSIVERICRIAGKYTPKYDYEKIYEELKLEEK